MTDDVVKIGAYGFYGDSKLAAITLAGGLESIDYNAFEGCEALTKIVIPSEVETIDGAAFCNCKSLSSVTLKEGDDEAIIGSRAFAGCISLKKMDIPGNYSWIGDYAFDGDTNLQSVFWEKASLTMLTNNQKIGNRVFRNCAKLTSVGLSKDLVSMGYDVFENCNPKLTITGTSESTVARDYAGANANIKFTTSITAPQLLKASSVSSSKVKISWNTVAGASSYTLYRKSGSSYTKVADTTSNSYTVAFDSSKAYAYAVKATGKVYGNSNRTSGYSSVINVGVALSKPSSVKAASASYKSVKISWKKVKNASGYYIYQKSGSKWKKVKTVSGANATAGTVSGLNCGTKYSFQVQAYYKSGTVYSYSKNSATVSARPSLSKVSIRSIGSPSAGKAKLTWKKVSGATGYYVYRSTSKSGKYTKVATIKKNSTVSFTDSTVKRGATYYYKVAAYRTVNKKNVSGSASSAKSVTIS